MNSIGEIIEVLMNSYTAGYCAASEKDYKGDDGLLHCHVCNEPKQRYHNGILIGRQCKCVRDAIQERTKQREKEAAAQRMAALRSASLMNGILADARFDKCTITQSNERNLGICKKYVENFDQMLKTNRGLLFYGNVGTGKSYAAACIANALIDKGYSVMMTSIVRLLSMPQDEEFDLLLRRMMSCSLVILDDLGAERDTGYALEKVYYVIESRHRTGKPLIVTTNLLLDDMRQIQDDRYGRTYDRVLDACYPMQWTGPSWRKVNAQSKFDDFEEMLGIKP